MNENELSNIIIGICLKIHRSLGPGLLESVYEEILCYELKKADIKYERQFNLPVIYDNVKIDIGFRADIIVEDKLILELKSIEELLPVHYKQLLTYLKISGKKLGLLINFNSSILKDGIHRIVNKL